MCSMLDEEFEKRAEARRKAGTWGGITRSHQELARLDLAYWQQQSPVDRLCACWLIQEDLRALRSDGSTLRLQRSVGGVRARER